MICIRKRGGWQACCCLRWSDRGTRILGARVTLTSVISFFGFGLELQKKENNVGNGGALFEASRRTARRVRDG